LSAPDLPRLNVFSGRKVAKKWQRKWQKSGKKSTRKFATFQVKNLKFIKAIFTVPPYVTAVSKYDFYE